MYIVGQDHSGNFSHRFRSVDGPSLRDAFTTEIQEWSYGGWQGERTRPRFGIGWQTRRIVDELRSTKLWVGDFRKGTLTIDPQRVGTVFSASKNNLRFHSDESLRYVNKKHRSSAHFLLSINGSSDYFGSCIAQTLGARGPRLSPVAACATGSHAIAMGAQLIEDSYADVAICGAIEPVLTPLVLAAYENMGALSKSHLMRPFDTRRDGFVPNVGAGCLILENEEKARGRGAQVLGYLSGWAMNADATHMTAMCPSGDSIARAIEYSMRRADVTNIDYINAHGTATKLNDETEARGIMSALGHKVAVSSTKPLTGHLLGAAGAVEAVISLLALRENFAPPTLNLEEADKECDLDLIVGKGRDVEMKSVLSLNYGFGGHIGALLFEKASE
jgi:3-oxoacyl-[acyl-carrier-protein] synthase II